jgi:hypothetical protein
MKHRQIEPMGADYFRGIFLCKTFLEAKNDVETTSRTGKNQDGLQKRRANP